MQISSGRRIGRQRIAALAIVAIAVGAPQPSIAQGVDCATLQAQIAASGNGGNRYAAAAGRQRAELDRTTAYARSLGCDRQQFLFFGSAPPPQCGALNARIAQMQGNLAQLQAQGGGGGGQRQQLIASFNAYCRGGGAVAERPRSFLEQLFGGSSEPAPQQPADGSDAQGQASVADDGVNAHGGSQAVCVRTCDGGFFPMNYSARRDSDTLTEMCHALCPNVETSVYTRAPSREIQTAVSLSGTPYINLPNALKYQKSFDPACTCRPANQTWAQTLANADALLGTERRGDIVVTPEKSAELSRPKIDAKSTTAKVARKPDVAAAPAVPDEASTADALAGSQVPTASRDSAGITPGSAGTVPYSAGLREQSTGPDGVTRSVRRVGPQL